MDDKKSRNTELDIVKGIATFLVVWGHIIQQTMNGANAYESVTYKMIYSVHMPLFMLISGYFFYFTVCKGITIQVLLKRIMSIFIPLVIWNTIHFICSLLIKQEFDRNPYSILISWLNEVLLGYWFLWAVIFASLAIGLTNKLLLQKFHLIGYIFSILLALLSPCRWVIISVYPFFVIGYLFSKNKETLLKRLNMKFKRIGIIILTGMYILSIFIYYNRDAFGNSEIKDCLDTTLLLFHGQFSISETASCYFDLVLYYFMGVTGSLFIILLIYKVFKKYKSSKLLHFFACIGMSSMQIYILQRVTIELLLAHVYKSYMSDTAKSYIINSIDLYSCTLLLIIAFLMIGLLLFIARLIDRSKIHKLLFGR